MHTVEKTKSIHNGIKRVIFCMLSILLELSFILFLMIKLNDYASIIQITTRFVAMIIVLFICSEDKASSLKLPWIILILLAPVMGVTLFIMIGNDKSTKNMKKRYQDIDERLFPYLDEHKEVLEELKEQNKQAGSISEYLTNYAHYPVYANTEVTYYDLAIKGLEAQLIDLSKAKDFIFMEYHAIEDAKAWHRIEKVLEERVQAGVEVRVFYDDVGSIGFITTDFIKKLEAKGISCRVFNPFAPGINLFLNNRDHRKMTIIDGKIGFTGGYNLANEYFNYTHPYGDWKDTGIRLEGDAVRSMTATFLEMWNAIKKNDQDDSDLNKYFLEYHNCHDGYIQPYADTPIDHELTGENVYLSMIEKAEKYCYFITPYLIITNEMTRALTLASKRGVDVRIITPGIPDKKIIYSVTRSFYHDLVKEGVHIYEWTPGFTHAKMCLVDDYMATCGTINLDYRSLYHHFENGCFMVNCKAIRDIKDDFDHTFTQCKDVSNDYNEGTKRRMRFFQLVLRVFAGLL